MQVVVLILVTMALPLSLQAAGFSSASLKGSYGFLVNKWTANSNAAQVSQVGVIAFDGAGRVAESYTAINGGVVQSATDSGTYAIRSDGTGTIDWIDGHHTAILLNSLAAGLAHGVQLLATDDNANEVIVGTAWLQSTLAQTYSLASLKGNFAYASILFTANANQPQQAAVGILSFDGKGKLKISFRSMTGGVLQTVALTGSYGVNPDGSGSLSASNGSQAVFVLNSKPTLSGTAKGLQFLETDTSGNIVICGTALKQ
jgi:hypothetical protein